MRDSLLDKYARYCVYMVHKQLPYSDFVQWLRNGGGNKPHFRLYVAGARYSYYISMRGAQAWFASHRPQS